MRPDPQLDYRLKSPFDVLQVDVQGTLIRERWAVVEALRTSSTVNVFQ